MDDTPEHGITPSMVASGTTLPTQDAINTAVHTIRSICGWHVWPVREETITVDTTGDDEVFLPTKRLIEVNQAVIGGTPLDHADYEFSEDGILHLNTRPRAGFRRLTAKIKHGHDIAPDLVAVIGQMARRAGTAQESLSVGGISVGASAVVTPQSTEWRVVDIYRLGPMP